MLDPAARALKVVIASGRKSFQAIICCRSPPQLFFHLNLAYFSLPQSPSNGVGLRR